jgi:heme exporter protein A
VLSVHALECARGERALIRDLSFDVPPGTLLEVRGANGSGKTTLLRALCGLYQPAAGTVSWNGSDIRKNREEYAGCIAYLGHSNALKDELTATENVECALRFAGLAARRDEIIEALRALGLESSKHLPCKALSQGQRRRAAWARLRLSRERPLWILDEPFSALDRSGIDAARELLESQLKAGGSVVLTTHERIAIGDRVAQQIEL